MINCIEKELCTGCKSCFNICPYQAITMPTDLEGFWYPFVNEKCKKCGLCLKICPSLNRRSYNHHFNTPLVYAAWSRNEEVRCFSTSGGIFSELAHQVLNDGGWVVGAQYTCDFLVEHSMARNSTGISRLRQSKYLQSDTNTIYQQTLEALELGKKILFCGTPCQNAALDTFLRRDYQNLVKCDFICRGVISPMVYTKYLEMLEERYGQPIISVTFKNKSRGWNGFCTKIQFTDGQEYIEDRNHDLYMIGYLKYNLYLRTSCHHCLYKQLPRVSDITLGDFWGIGRTRPHLDEDKGTSVVLLNSNRGQQLFEKISKRVEFEECTLDEAIKGNVCILESTPKGPCRNVFFQEILANPFDVAFNKVVSLK
ncbi:4Fe-4S dicluster domain-containing protein [Alkaliphilus pronyensis]|uniref:4Fe-4S dicluster domain-containing protein n=1 Tax=Alkaliphilus pronyensis TaxID=1482732 RepID=A0A6I0FH41_9FIRM|nr:Coenzyme F420 hydrogenase/dehydrogenase, beta subunit C-terminal domain [Alkaliphilus pronyensis]KAB3539662.1 4Fe-4S dicluster domain-containing protein [Alkaliphilus pronyensis]